MAVSRTAKEFVRHTLHRLGYRPKKPHVLEDRKASFAAIYEQGVWVIDGADPLSGSGSSLAATETLRAQLPAILSDLGTRTLLDVGCGDFTWMQSIDLPCDYVGVDIVPSVIARNQELYAAPSRTFRVMDVVTDVPPAADTVLCREVLFHLSFDDIRALLANVLAAGCQHLLLTSDRDTGFNSDIDSGDFRSLNLEKRPFGIAPPRLRIDDAVVANGRYVGLWAAEDIRRILN